MTVFALHMMVATEAAGPYVEFSIEGSDHYPWLDRVYHPTLVAHDGKVSIPDGPGWGIVINLEWLAKATYQISRLG